MLLKTILSAAMSAAVAVSPCGAPTAAGVPTAELHERLAGMVADRHITAGLIYVENGARRWSDAVGVRDLRSGIPASAQGYFRIGSVTKTFVAVVLLQLVDEGRLTLDEPTDRYLPGVVPNGTHITVRQILQHTSGLYDYAHEPGYSTNRWRGEGRFDDYLPSELLAVAFAKDPHFPPGTSWRYSNTNYVVAGLLIEKLTGHPYGKEVEQRVLRPLHLTDSSVPGHRPTLPMPHARGYESLKTDPPTDPPTIVDATEMDPSLDYAAGEMISTTRDQAKFVRALLDGRLTSATGLTQMRRTTAALPGLYRYGLGLQEFAIPCADGPKQTWGHTGGLIGYTTVTLSDGKGRSLVLSLNPYEQDPPLDAVLSVATAAFCR
ncbi:serine hydrolase domain-containing protein [Amycolatopsis anabasis]|uniref:serine hydrolase domain-containing protein n=1 Tax=Amycolatopsis anabasis TaxID=1840409 RepID=UPI00131BA692|nr:serine hydrolase domain-containing protein [Amycolatopsis anabasis]